MKKKILFDGTCISSTNAGVGNYALSLIKSLQAYRDEVEFHLITRPGSNAEGIAAQTRLVDVHSNRIRKLAPWDCCGFGRSYSLLHEPNFVPQRFAGPVVVTIHDLTAFLFPQYHPATRVCWAKLFHRRMAAADHILTISQHSKQDIVDYLRVPADKVTVTYPGGPRQLVSSQDPASEAGFLVSKKIREPFILSVGTLEPRKNIKRLLEAFAQFSQCGGGRDTCLVLAGGKGWHTEDLFRQIASCGIADKVVVTGYVTDSQLSLLYRRALVFVYPSLYEGFGLPPLEAMAHGTPVIVSNASSLPEVVGDAGILIDPRQTEDIATALRLVVESGSMQAELRSKSLARAAGFSWEQCAAETMAVYRRMMG